jgi:hypothetical protein
MPRDPHPFHFLLSIRACIFADTRWDEFVCEERQLKGELFSSDLNNSPVDVSNKSTNVSAHRCIVDDARQHRFQDPDENKIGPDQAIGTGCEEIDFNLSDKYCSEADNYQDDRFEGVSFIR